MMRLLPRSLFGQLVLILVAGLIVALVVTAAINLHKRGNMMRQASMQRTAEKIATTVRMIDMTPKRTRIGITRVLASPRLRVDFGPPPRATTVPKPARAFLRTLSAQLGPHYRLRFARVGQDLQPLAENNSQAPYLNIVAVQLSDGAWLRFTGRHHPPGRIWSSTLLIELGALLAILVAFSLFALWRATRPLAMLAAAARGLGRDIHRAPLDEHGPTEVRRAARAFNLMQRKLLSFIEGRVRLLTAISHDLKTPVTRLRLRAEMLDDKTLAEGINRDLDEMEAMLEATIAYLRGEARQEPIQPLDINALVESMAADAKALDQPVTFSGHAQVTFLVRPRALRRAIENLVQNALRYAGSAEITLSENPNGLTIRVADRGSGIPEAELERVFEPFYRLEASRNRSTGGTGLGLAIARDIAEAHGGTLTLANRDGGGLVATLSLPR